MIITVADVRAEVMQILDTDTSPDADLYRIIGQVEKRFQQMVGFEFVPRSKTVYMDNAGDDGYIMSGGARLILPEPLLDLTTVTNGNEGAVDSGDYVLLFPDMLTSGSPYREILQFDEAWVGYASDTTDLITIEGVWGWHSDYANAWLSANDTLQADVSDSATSIEVGDADGADIQGYTPRFSPGQLIKIGDECLHVTAVNNTSNVLTVERGQLGTTAAAHLTGAAISTWKAEPDAVRACTRWAGTILTRQGAFEVSRYEMSGTTIQYPQDAPAETLNVIEFYRENFSIGGFAT